MVYEREGRSFLDAQGLCHTKKKKVRVGILGKKKNRDGWVTLTTQLFFFCLTFQIKLNWNTHTLNPGYNEPRI